MKRVIQVIATILLAGVIVYSFIFIGSPQHNRLLLEDKAAINQIKQLDCALHRYYAVEGKLPQNLEELLDHRNIFNTNKPGSSCQYSYCRLDNDADFKDKKTGQFYEYLPKGSSYAICANFNFDSKELKRNQASDYYNFGINDKEFEDYNQGHSCFNEVIVECKK